MKGKRAVRLISTIFAWYIDILIVSYGLRRLGVSYLSIEPRKDELVNKLDELVNKSLEVYNKTVQVYNKSLQMIKNPYIYKRGVVQYVEMHQNGSACLSPQPIDWSASH